MALLLPAVAFAQDVTVNIGDLPPGKTVTVVFQATVDNPVAAGVVHVENQGTVSGTNFTSVLTDDPDEAGASDPTVTLVSAVPNLAIAKSDGDVTVMPGGTVVYTLTAVNGGNQGATFVVLTDTVPANTTFDGGASSGAWSCLDGDPAGTVCTLPVGTLAGGGGMTMADFAVNVVSPLPAGVTDVTNCASVADDGSNGADPNPGDNSTCEATPIDAAPDLTITKDDAGVTASPGDTVTYTLGYDNVGDQGATGVVLTDTVPADTTFNAAASTAGWVCVPDATPGSVCTLAIGSVAVGGSASASFAVDIASPAPAGLTQIDNCASIADDGANGSDQTPGDNSDCDATPVDAAPDLTVTKDDGGVTTVPGGAVAYTITYDNVGNQDATGVVLTETVPAGSISSANAGWVLQGTATACDAQPAGTICELALGSLSVGGGSTAAFMVVVDDPLAAGIAQLDNCVSIADDATNGTDPNLGDNSFCDATPVDATPDLAITKTYTGPAPFPGDTFTFDLDYENVGNQGATGVVITDTVPTATTSGTNSGWVVSGGALPCDGQPAGTICELDVGSLAGGGASGSATFEVVLDDPLPPATPDVTNTACVADDGANGVDPNPGNDCDDEIVNLDIVPPTVDNLNTTVDTGDGTLDACETATVPISRILVTFDEEMGADVSDPTNYRLVSPVLGSDFDTAACAGGTGNDIVIPISDVTYDDVSHTATLDVGGLPNAQYRVLACGTLTDLAGNPLDGDGDGTGGDDFVRDFRVDTENLFANGHFDCDIDDWVVDTTVPGAEMHSPEDADGSPISGSGEAFNPFATGNPEAVTYAQCVPVLPEVELTLDGSVRLDTTAPLLGIDVFCEVYDGPDCTGSLLDGESLLLLSGDTGATFLPFGIALVPPAGSVSAVCGAGFSAGAGEAFDGFLDRMTLTLDAEIFADGFESGDTSAWSSTVP